MLHRGGRALRKAWATTEVLLRTPGIWAAAERVAEALLVSPNSVLDEDEIAEVIGDDLPHLYSLARPWRDAEQAAACRMDWSCRITRGPDDELRPVPIAG